MKAKNEKIGIQATKKHRIYLYQQKVLPFNIFALVGCNLKHFSVSNATNSTNIDFYQQSNDDGKIKYIKKGNRKYLRNKRTLISFCCSSYRICHLTLLKW